MSFGDITNVTTGKVRLSYVHLFKPFAFTPGQEEKFSCTILVPKTDTETMTRIHNAIEAAKQRGISDKWNGQCPPVVPDPVYDGDGIRPLILNVKGTGCLLPTPKRIVRRKLWGLTAVRLSTSPKFTAVFMPMSMYLSSPTLLVERKVSAAVWVR